MRRLYAAAVLPVALSACTIQLPGSNVAPTVTETVTSTPTPTRSSTTAPAPQGDATSAIARTVRERTTVYDAVSDDQIIREAGAWCESIDDGLAAGSPSDVAVTAAFNAGGTYAAQVYGADGARDFGVLAGQATGNYCPEHIAAINEVLATNGVPTIAP